MLVVPVLAIGSNLLPVPPGPSRKIVSYFMHAARRMSMSRHSFYVWCDSTVVCIQVGHVASCCIQTFGLSAREFKMLPLEGVP